MLKEAVYYDNSPENKGEVHCSLCPHNCLIPPEKSGFCGVRKNIKNKLIALNYPLVSSLALDPIEKKPLYEFYPGAQILSLGTIGCNLKCLHCQNYKISREREPEKLSLQKITPGELAYLVSEKKYSFVAFTYNEPFIWYEYVLASAKLLKKMGTKIVFVTNGYVNLPPLIELLPYIDAFSLDIKWGLNQTAQKLSGVKNCTPVYETAGTIFNEGKHLEITTNIVDGYNDSEQELAIIAQFIAKELSPEIPWHISRSFPAYKLAELKPTPLATMEKAVNIGRKAGLKKIYTGNL